MEIADYPQAFVPLGAKPAKGENLLGVELELLHPEGFSFDAMRKVKRSLLPDENLFLAAAIYDGSVVGSEFVTHPAPLAIHQRYWPQVLTKFRDAGYHAAPDAGGLHVHVSRAGWLPGQLDFLAALVIFGGEDWERFQVSVMGRDSARWARGEPISEARPWDIRYSMKRGHDYVCGLLETETVRDTRYRRLNVLPEKTVEFRQGHCSTRVDRVLQRIEFVDAVVVFAREAAKRGNPVKVFPYGLPSARAFLSWVQRHEKVWPHLAQCSA